LGLLGRESDKLHLLFHKFNFGTNGIIILSGKCGIYGNWKKNWKLFYSYLPLSDIKKEI
jgi:hypothetical protein